MTEITVYYQKQGDFPSDFLLRTAAALYSGLDPRELETVRAYGKKPYFLRHPEIQASVSHSCGIWAAAFSSSGPVGLDIQKVVRSSRRDSIARRYFHLSEAEAVFSAPDPDEAFSRIWCRKEAAVKLSGRGIDKDFSSFDSTARDPVTVFGEALYLCDIDLPNCPALYACAAAKTPFTLRISPFITESELNEAIPCSSTPSNS